MPASASGTGWPTVKSTDTDLRLPDALPDDVYSPEVAADLVRRLLGVGPGLTPAGDDVLAGLFVGLWSFGQNAEPLRLTVLAGLSAGTTDLSAALLRCAARGESIPQVNQLLRTISEGAWPGRLDHAMDDLVRVGHTSGTALATGVLAAATMAIGDPGRADAAPEGSARTSLDAPRHPCQTVERIGIPHEA